MMRNTADTEIERYLSGVRWYGSLNRTVRRQAKPELIREIKKLWIDGHLPYQYPGTKEWVVGYHISLRDMTYGYSRIKVGPKRPSKFRDRYLKMLHMDEYD